MNGQSLPWAALIACSAFSGPSSRFRLPRIRPPQPRRGRMDQSINRERLRSFVTRLFLDVMDTPQPKPEWVERWIDIGMGLRDPLELFERFVAQPGVVKAHERKLDAR